MPRNATAFEVEADDHDLNVSKPGAYRFTYREDPSKPVGIIIGCPCGCGGRGICFFAGCNGGSHEWSVEGVWPKVTLRPSIGIRCDASGNTGPNGSYHWHGFLENGEFVER
jgi:hypothetical protein